jgi:hypothetical protein
MRCHRTILSISVIASTISVFSENASADCKSPQNSQIASRCQALGEYNSMVYGLPREQWNRVWFVANGPLLPIITVLPNHRTLNLHTGEVGPILGVTQSSSTKQSVEKSKRIINYWSSYRQQVFEINQSGKLAFGAYPCEFDCAGHEAGYEWAKREDISETEDCEEEYSQFNQTSQQQGCKVYVDQKDNL